MQSKKYIKEMEEIHASEELIKNTIHKINEKNTRKTYNYMKKILLGTAAMMMFSISSFATYILVTGNTEILNRLGIHISQNYEENKQIIDETNKNTKFKGNNFETEIVAISMDSSSIVAEIDVKLKKEIPINELILDIKDVSIFNENGEAFEINYTIKQSSAKQENGTYKCFAYISILNPATSGNYLLDLFQDKKTLPVQIQFEGLKDSNNNSIEECKWNFKINLNKQENDNSSYNKELIKLNTIKDIKLVVSNYQNSKFGNIIEVIASQENCNINEINKIQKIDFIVKNQNNEVVNIISRTNNITMDQYNKGKMTEIAIETKLVVDDVTENEKYTIEIIETDEVKIPKENVKEVNNEIIKDLKANNDTAVCIDGYFTLIDYLDENEYYKDEYGIYRTNLTYEDIIKRFEN